MTVKALTLDEPWTQSLATTWQEFTCTKGRNMIIHFDDDVYYHPDGEGKDGDAITATEVQKIAAGTRSLRIPGSGSGSNQIHGGQEAPLNKVAHFAFAAISGTPSIWITIVSENVSK